MKALKPGKLVFTVPEEWPKTSSQRENFQKKLLSYTEDGKDVQYRPIVSDDDNWCEATQQVIKFKTLMQRTELVI